MENNKKILDINVKKDEKILRKKTKDFDFKKVSKEEIRILVRDMKDVMRSADGVGLAANQIGMDVSVFVAEFAGKSYAIFNPEIVSSSKELATDSEGCLSVPGRSGDVARSFEITIKGFDKNGKRIKMKTWGHLARIFQHEIDHLNGKLFIDRI